MATLNLESTTNKKNLIPSPVHIKHSLNETMGFLLGISTIFVGMGLPNPIPKLSQADLCQDWVYHDAR